MKRLKIPFSFRLSSTEINLKIQPRKIGFLESIKENRFQFFIFSLISLNLAHQIYSFEKLKDKTKENRKKKGIYNSEDNCEEFFIHCETVENLNKIEKIFFAIGIGWSEVLMPKSKLCYYKKKQ